MAKEAAEKMGAAYVEEYGNILAPTYLGWSNIYNGYYLGSAGYAPPDTLGRPVMFSHYVHSWLDGQPYWAQSPIKLFGVGLGSIQCPVADAPNAPPLNEIY